MSFDVITWSGLVVFLKKANSEVFVRARGRTFDIELLPDVFDLLQIPVAEWTFFVKGDRAAVEPELTKIWGPGITIV